MYSRHIHFILFYLDIAYYSDPACFSAFYCNTIRCNLKFLSDIPHFVATFTIYGVTSHIPRNPYLNSKEVPK